MTIHETLDALEVALRSTKYPVRASGQEWPAGETVIAYELIGDTDLPATSYLASRVEVQIDIYSRKKSVLQTAESRLLAAIAGVWTKLRTNTIEYTEGWHRQSLDIETIRQEV